MEDTAQHEEEFEEVNLGRYAAIAVVVALIVAVGAFFAGKAAAGSSGPSTLAAAVTQARDGKLPCGGNPAATPAANAAPGARGGSDFLVQAVCNRSGQGTTFRRGTGNGGGGFGFFGGGPGGAAGTLTAVNGSTLTIRGRQGTQKVTLGANATIRKLGTGSKGDLKAGQSVIVGGAGPNGSGTAQTVTIVPSTQGQ
jgi:hypothetical protein